MIIKHILIMIISLHIISIPMSYGQTQPIKGKQTEKEQPTFWTTTKKAVLGVSAGLAAAAAVVFGVYQYRKRRGGVEMPPVQYKQPDPYNPETSLDEDMLKRALTSNNTQEIEAAITSKNINLNAAMLGGRLSPLYESVDAKNVDITRFLLDKGADANIAGILGDPIIFNAIDSTYNQVEIIRLLIQHGADVNAISAQSYQMPTSTKGKSEFTHLKVIEYAVRHNALYRNIDGVVEFLLDNGAKPTNRCLMYALQGGDAFDVRMIVSLLNHGIKPEDITIEGLSPLDYVKKYGGKSGADQLIHLLEPDEHEAEEELE